MSTKITAETILNQLNRDPESAEAILVYPMWIGSCPLTSIPAVLDFQMRPIAQSEDGFTTILASDEPPYPYLNRARVIDLIKLELFCGVQGLPNACRIVDEWDLVDEIVRRVALFKLGKLPHYVCGQR